jgi:hypothetical protein
MAERRNGLPSPRCRQQRSRMDQSRCLRVYAAANPDIQEMISLYRYERGQTYASDGPGRKGVDSANVQAEWIVMALCMRFQTFSRGLFHLSGVAFVFFRFMFPRSTIIAK